MKLLPRVILDRLIRRKAALHTTPCDKYRVRIAHTLDEHQDAFKLLHIAYVFQGIESVRNSDMRITAQHVLPESTVFVAYDESSVVGTMTATLDSPAGLPLEKDYPELIAQLRAKGARLVEYGSLAVVRRCWHTGVTNLLNMACHWFSFHVLEATHCVIGINPKAKDVYRALYAFRSMGEAKFHAELNAPVAGMIQDLMEVQEFLVRHYRRPMATGISVGKHFTETLPPCIELPSHKLEELTRWKLPREVFQELFINQSDRLDSLDPKTREHLEGWRSLRTLGKPATDPGVASEPPRESEPPSVARQPYVTTQPYGCLRDDDAPAGERPDDKPPKVTTQPYGFRPKRD
jgi:hypothetical protein